MTSPADRPSAKSISQSQQRSKAVLKPKSRSQFTPHGFVAFHLGIGGVGGFYGNLSHKNRYIPPHKDDLAKYDHVETEPFSKDEGNADQFALFPSVEMGYKFLPYLAIKNRFSFSIFNDGGYPPRVRKQYATGQNAFTYLVPKFLISNTLIMNLCPLGIVGSTGRHRYGVGIEVGYDLSVVGYEYGWDRYARREKGGVRRAVGHGIQVGIFFRIAKFKFGVSNSIQLHGAHDFTSLLYLGVEIPFGLRKNNNAEGDHR